MCATCSIGDGIEEANSGHFGAVTLQGILQPIANESSTHRSEVLCVDMFDARIHLFPKRTNPVQMSSGLR